MTFIKGQSGNPKGRPRGIIDKRQRMQKALGEGADALIAVIKARALDGDMQAAGLVLSRLVPTMKADGALIQFEFDATLPIAKQAEQVLAAIADGKLSAESGKAIIDAIHQLGDIRATEELEARLVALESKSQA